MAEYLISKEKLEKITKIIQKEDSAATKEEVKDALCSYWSIQGEDHQRWLDTAEVQEIVVWVNDCGE